MILWSSLNRSLLVALSMAAVMLMASTTTTSAFVPHPNRYSTALSMTTTTSSASSDPVALKTALQKPSKVLTIGLEITNTVDTEDLDLLSMQLRKSKVSALYTSSIESLKLLVKEQEIARGNFPGSVPIIYCGGGDDADLEKAAEAGAYAAVVPAESDDAPTTIPFIFKIASTSDLEQVLPKLQSIPGSAVLIENENTEEMEKILRDVPKGTVCIVALPAMMEDGQEVELAKTFKKQGVHSIFIQNSIVGDAEDLEYARFAISGMTSKASSEFKMSTMTGSTSKYCTYVHIIYIYIIRKNTCSLF